MKISQQKFYEYNWADFVHIKALRNLLKDVAKITSDVLPDHKSIDELNFKTDKYGEQELHVIYTDLNNEKQDQLMKPAITDRVNELIDNRFRWIETGDSPIKKLELADHLIKVTTPNNTFDFIVPYIYSREQEQKNLSIDDNADYITIKVVNRQTNEQTSFMFPTKANFDDLKKAFNDFKTAMLEWQQKVNDHLAKIDDKDKEQDRRLDQDDQTLKQHQEHLQKIDDKDKEQDQRLDKDDQTLKQHQEHLQKVDDKDKEQDQRLDKHDQHLKNVDELTNQLSDDLTSQGKHLEKVDQTDHNQDDQIKRLQDNQVNIQQVVDILQSKSHNFLTALEDPANFNNIENDGNYFVYHGQNDKLTGEHRPSDEWGILYNYNHDNTRIQIYVANKTNKLFVRSLNDEWSDWFSMSSSDSVSEMVNNLTKAISSIDFTDLNGSKISSCHLAVTEKNGILELTFSKANNSHVVKVPLAALTSNNETITHLDISTDKVTDPDVKSALTDLELDNDNLVTTTINTPKQKYTYSNVPVVLAQKKYTDKRFNELKINDYVLPQDLDKILSLPINSIVNVSFDQEKLYDEEILKPKNGWEISQLNNSIFYGEKNLAIVKQYNDFKYISFLLNYYYRTNDDYDTYILVPYTVWKRNGEIYVNTPKHFELDNDPTNLAIDIPKVAFTKEDQNIRIHPLASESTISYLVPSSERIDQLEQQVKDLQTKLDKLTNKK